MRRLWPLGLVAACFDTPSTLGQPCRRAEDCDGTLVCVSGTCQGFADDMSTDSGASSGGPTSVCADGVPDDPVPCLGEPNVIAAGHPTVLAVADLDGDGVPEVIGNGPSIYRPLHGIVTLNPAPVPASSIVVLDANDDGHLDVVTSSDTEPCAKLWPGDGEGRLGDPVESWCDLGPLSLAVARVGGTNRLVGGHGAGAVLGNGTTRVDLPLDGAPFAADGLCAGTLYGGGDSDIVAATGADAGGAIVWRSSGAETYASGRFFATGSPETRCQLVDLDADGGLDVLLTPSLHWIPHPELDESTPQLRQLTPPRDGAATADWESDGDADLLVWTAGVPGLQLWIREDNGTFAAPVPLLETVQALDGRLADITGDGHVDLLVGAGRLGLVWIPHAP